jgi:hypothetical protein
MDMKVGAGGREGDFVAPLATSVATTVVVAGVLAPSSFRGTGSESTASTTDAPASRAPHVIPPSPAKRSTTRSILKQVRPSLPPHYTKHAKHSVHTTVHRQLARN